MAGKRVKLTVYLNKYEPAKQGQGINTNYC
jgi:hypothetical protein